MPGLYETNGHRTYLTLTERERFLKAAETFPREGRTFCLVLVSSGCRISEALALTAGRVDLAGGALIFESLKQRRTGIYRTVPMPCRHDAATARNNASNSVRVVCQVGYIFSTNGFILSQLRKKE